MTFFLTTHVELKPNYNIRLRAPPSFSPAAAIGLLMRELPASFKPFRAHLNDAREG
jgi:hypothetical protein